MYEPESVGEITAQRNRSKLLLRIGAITAVLAVVVVIALALMKQKQDSPFLDNALRAGSPEFEAYKARVTLTPSEKQEVLAQTNSVDMVRFTIKAEIHNQSDRTLTGVEVIALVYDLEDKIIAQKVGQPIPRQRSAPLKPGERSRFVIGIDAPAKYTEADVKLVKAELHGLQFQ